MAQKHLVVGRFTRRPLGNPARAVVLAVGSMVLTSGAAWAQSAEAPVDPAWPYEPPPEVSNVPPHVEEAAIASNNGRFCFAGPHPADPRFAPGLSWDDSPGVHVHDYPPLDLRLFAFQNGCYSFIGDPTDFGYRGQTYAYYGAHPVLPAHGTDWCFMIGGHRHGWQPWSPYFVVAGPWFYWQGPYDRVFWNHWPYYATYYRHHYPTYYRGGRFARGGWRDRGRGGYAVAPPLGRGQAHGRGQRGAPTVAGPVPDGKVRFGTPAANPGWQQPNPGWQQTSPGRGTAQADPGWGTARPAWGGQQRPQPVVPAPAPAPVPSVVAPSVNTWAPSNRSSFGRDASGTTFRPAPAAPSAGTFRPAPVAPSGGGFRPAPVAPSGGTRSFTLPANGSFSRPVQPTGGSFRGFQQR
jgi:hypothetical protein